MTTDTSEEKPGAIMLKCSHCSKEFKYNSERNRHELSHSPRFECEICCKKFSFVSALRRHQKQHERTGSVKCQECNRKFRDEVLLKRHMKYAHKGTYTCSKCSATFNSDQALHTHMKTHKPESERRFKCSFDGCGKSFNFSHHLKHHELTHTNVKQHYCSVCGKGFIQSHHLKTHVKTHIPSEWIYCKFSGCKKKFATEYARKRHMATHKIKPDSGISSDSNSCDASISSKEYLEDSILCAICGENVLQADYMKHSEKCGDNSRFSSNSGSLAMSLTKQESILEQTTSTNPTLDKDIGDCKSALGGCIMGASNCVCAQISKPIEENYDFVPLENSENSTNGETNNVGFIDKYSEVMLKFFDDSQSESVLKKTELIEETKEINHVETENISQNNENNMCERCDCASSCNVKEPLNCNIKNEVPNIEYRADGVVKIKDTFDIDLPIKEHKESIQFVPFSTCRDVIGNCIVGGNEGCLCARMMMDEQQAMAQEIDDITPQPKTEIFT